NVSELHDVGCLHGFEAPSGVDVVPDLVGVPHRRAHATDALVGPDCMEQALERSKFALREQRGLLDHILEDVSLGLVTKVMTCDLLHRDQADALFPAGVEGPVKW